MQGAMAINEDVGNQDNMIANLEALGNEQSMME
jgi:hypothetical protein